MPLTKAITFLRFRVRIGTNFALQILTLNNPFMFLTELLLARDLGRSEFEAFSFHCGNHLAREESTGPAFPRPGPDALKLHLIQVRAVEYVYVF